MCYSRADWLFPNIRMELFSAWPASEITSHGDLGVWSADFERSWFESQVIILWSLTWSDMTCPWAPSHDLELDLLYILTHIQYFTLQYSHYSSQAVNASFVCYYTFPKMYLFLCVWKKLTVTVCCWAKGFRLELLEQLIKGRRLRVEVFKLWCCSNDIISVFVPTWGYVRSCKEVLTDLYCCYLSKKHRQNYCCWHVIIAWNFLDKSL